MQILIAGDIDALPRNQDVQTFVRGLLPPPPPPGPRVVPDDSARFIVAPVRAAIPAAADCSCGPVDLDDQPEQLSAVLDATGIALLHRGCVKEAAPFIERALAIRISLFGEEHPVTASSYLSHARLLRLSGRLAEAERDARRGIAIDTRVYGGDGFPLVSDFVELGGILLQLGEFSTAEATARSGLAILERLKLTDTDPNTSRLLDIIGRVAQVRSRYEEATAIYQKVLAIDAQQVGDKHLKFATHLANFATVKLGQRKLEAARDDLVRAQAILENDVHRPKHPNLIDVLTILGSVQQQLGDPKAETTLKRALELNITVRGEDSTFVATDLVRLGRLHVDHGQFDVADGEFGKALAIYTRRLPPSHAFIGEAQTWKARGVLENPRRDAQSVAAARALLEGALTIWNIEFDKRSIEIAITSALLGRALFLQDPGSERARQLLTASLPIIQATRAGTRIVTLVSQWIEEIDKCTPPRGPGREGHGFPFGHHGRHFPGKD